jgi:hypothetical protein
MGSTSTATSTSTTAVNVNVNVNVQAQVRTRTHLRQGPHPLDRHPLEQRDDVVQISRVRGAIC